MQYQAKVLCVLPLPPPVHGSSVMCEKIRQSRLINEALECDNGLIAVFLYYVTILLMIGHALIVYCGPKVPSIKLCSITAGATLAGVAATMYSDNVVNYSMCTLAYPFGFYGMMLGLLQGERRKEA